MFAKMRVRRRRRHYWLGREGLPAGQQGFRRDQGVEIHQGPRGGVRDAPVL